MEHELHLKLTVRLMTSDGRRCFGPGVAALLAQVDRCRSLRSAAASMEMAYSKAWRIVHTAEESFGCKLLSSTVGGAHGGGAILTPEGTQLLEAYNAYLADVEAYARRQFPELLRHPPQAKPKSPAEPE